MVGLFVEELPLREDEVRGEEDVGAEGGEEGVEGRGRGGVEDREGAWRNFIVSGLVWVVWEGFLGLGGGVGRFTMFSPRWGGCEGAAGLGDEAAETGAAVVG